VALVVNPLSLSSSAEWLAGAASCPEGPVVGPSSKSSCERPSTDPSEKMALRKFFEFIGLHLLDASFVNDARRNVTGIN